MPFWGGGLLPYCFKPASQEAQRKMFLDGECRAVKNNVGEL